MRTGQKRAVELVIVLIVFIFLFLSSIPQTFAAFNAVERIYIHPAGKEWYDLNYRTECNLIDCSTITGNANDIGKWCCNVMKCVPGIEGNYLYTYFVGGHIDGEQTSPTPENHSSEITIWSPVYFDNSQLECACGSYIWEGETNWDAVENKYLGACCGDDPASGPNPYGTTQDIDDPDMGPAACTSCLRAQFGTVEEAGLRHWSKLVTDDSNRCCGDDASDCGAVAGTYICSDIPGTTTTYTSTTECTDPLDPECTPTTTTTITTEQGPWFWRNSADGDHTGAILDSLCAEPDMAYLSNGGEWILCFSSNFSGKTFDINNYGTITSNEVSNPYIVEDHAYICYYEESGGMPSEFMIAECCGGNGTAEPFATCNNDYRDSVDLGGIDAFSGDSIILKQRTFFCREDYKISEELDDSPYACNNARYPNATSRYYLWTGTKCCSEPSDFPEYYNDPNGTGACFNSTPVRNGQRFEWLREVTAIEGKLRGCNISATNYIIGNEWLLDLKDTYTGQPLIEDIGYCTVDPTGYSYCDYSEEWKPTLGKNPSNLVYVPDSSWLNQTGDVKGGCCEPNTCWTGRDCHPDQAQHPTWGPYKEQYRCANGEWVWSEYKKGLDGYRGYCPSNEQCLVTISTATNKPTCIFDGQYIDDNYCDKGNWSSRTKFLALALLNITSPEDDYILYCGPYTDTLNYYDYATEFGFQVENLFSERKANNICLLEHNDNLILATSLNVDIDSNEIDIGEILVEFKDCNPRNESGFYSCENTLTDKAWLNNELRSIIYSKQAFQLNQNPSFIQIFSSFIRSPLSTLLAILQQSPTTKSYSYEFLEQGLKFDRLYAAKKGNKNLMATLDEDTIIVRYDMDTDPGICKIVSTYNATRISDESKIACTKTETGNAKTFNIIGMGGEFANINPFAIWSDLTGKLRLE